MTVIWQKSGPITPEERAAIRNENTCNILPITIRLLDALEDQELQVKQLSEEKVSMSEAADLVGKTVQTIQYWKKKGYIVQVLGSRPARFYKKDIIAAMNRQIKSGRPKKED